MKALALLAIVSLGAAPLRAQATEDPFPAPIPVAEDVVEVGFREFAQVPDVGGEPARVMLLVDEPGTERLFVNDMRGILYAVAYDGSSLTSYLDLREARWGVGVEAGRSEQGFQSFAFHPQFALEGSPGFGKLYTWVDVSDTGPTPDFTPGGGDDTHDTVLLEWTARTPAAARYDGSAPRQVLRVEQPFRNHNGGQIAFDPTPEPGSAEFGLLYVGIADGGSGGDPLNLAQNLGSAFGKIFRIDPLGSGGGRGGYGIPAGNPFVGRSGVLGEIWASGVRNPQRFTWDSANRRMFMADIGQGTVEELSPVTAGANLGWNVWEGSFRYVGRRSVELSGSRSDRSMTYPVAEYGQPDPLLQNSAAATGVVVVRGGSVPQLDGLLLWGDNPSGEVFYLHADHLPDGGEDGIRRVLLRQGGRARTFLEVIQAKNREQGRELARRADLRFGTGPGAQVFLLNKQDGVIRLLTR
ncbi:MAG: PQQ-dependent sugar dehydrogenase [Gemmatimonadota bacterium]